MFQTFSLLCLIAGTQVRAVTFECYNVLNSTAQEECTDLMNNLEDNGGHMKDTNGRLWYDRLNKWESPKYLFHKLANGPITNYDNWPLDGSQFTRSINVSTRSVRTDAGEGKGDFTNCPWWKGKLVAKEAFPIDDLPRDSTGNLIIPDWVYNYFTKWGERPWTQNFTGNMVPGDGEFFWSNWINGRIPKISTAHNMWGWSKINSEDFPECKYKTYIFDNTDKPAKKFNEDFLRYGWKFSSKGGEYQEDLKCGWTAADFGYSANSYLEGVFGHVYREKGGMISKQSDTEPFWRHHLSDVGGGFKKNEANEMYMPGVFIPSIHDKRWLEERYDPVATRKIHYISTWEEQGGSDPSRSPNFTQMAEYNPGWSGIESGNGWWNLWFRTGGPLFQGFGLMNKTLVDKEAKLKNGEYVVFNVTVDTEKVLLSKIWAPRARTTIIPTLEEDILLRDEACRDGAAIYTLSVPLVVMAIIFYN